MKEFSPHNAFDTLERIKNQYAKAEGLVAGLDAKKKSHCCNYDEKVQ